MNSVDEPFFIKLINQYRTPLPFINEPHFHIVTYQNILATSLEMLSSNKHGLVFLHFPIPHPPFIYDPTEDRLSVAKSTPAAYLNNVILADQTLKRIRTLMQNYRIWDTSSIIVTSDHSSRWAERYDGKYDRRVPLLIKLPFDHTGIVIESKIHTLVLRNLISALLRNEITNTSAAIHWFDTHGK